ncbi:hypothetical protein EDF82_0993 [Raoultella sp. BIGb0399]|uniref:hypothetical protein n=1 Tax=Raoultella sp. BIGb0399 TaxID=2485119 RepID=UPI000F4C6DDE|nr:hypothetical protein [Raoultella sp. BIGb0399]ROS15884.1 hypothetical protein EDF82_0993 [Raoultella sp. BIGb0399]
MSLRTERTKWVLFLPCSQPVADQRHVMDLVYGVFCLERAGISPNDIFIYIDSPSQNYNGFFGLASAHPFIARPSSDFFSDLMFNDYANLVMFVSGHGGPKGMDGPQPITPSQLLNALKNAPNLDKAIIYLGQCYAGTFNYVNAGKGRGQGPEIIIAGATNLHESLSLSTTEQFIAMEFPWYANVFLLHVFKWMSSPFDVDGDGAYTIMDSYKHAGMYSNYYNKAYKTSGFMKIVDAHHEYKRLKEIADTDTGDVGTNTQNGLDCKAKYEIYTNQLDLHYIHQESWILNSRPAQLIEF